MDGEPVARCARVVAVRGNVYVGDDAAEGQRMFQTDWSEGLGLDVLGDGESVGKQQRKMREVVVVVAEWDDCQERQRNR